MANEYYDHTTYPATGAAGSSAALRAELDAIETGFDKLPTLAGNANKVVKVNAAGTALEANNSAAPLSADVLDSGLIIHDNADNNKTFKFEASGLSSGVQRTLTVPDASTTLVGTDTTQTLTNKTLTSPTVSGGTINNAVIGGSTPAAGTFTTLSATGNVTLGDASTDTLNVGNGGIIKDASGNVGIGGTPVGYKLNVFGQIKSGGTGFDGGFVMGRTSDGLVVGSVTLDSATQTLTYANALGSGVHSFTVNSVERMRIDSSGNVGVGKSPAKKLDVEGAARFVQDAAATTGAIVLRQNSGDTVGGFIQWVNNANSVEKGWFVVDTSSNMLFATGSTERMRIDASGNVGIGETSPGTYGRCVAKGSSAFAPAFLARNDGTAGGWARIDAFNSFASAPLMFFQNAAGEGFVRNDSSSPSISFEQSGSQRLKIDTIGNVLVTSATGLGYGTGAGGTVTQGSGSGKATAVTLNKPSGRITMNNSALAGNTAIAFIVNNTVCAVTDTVSCNCVGGTGDVNAYIATAFPFAGGFYISLRNMTGGSLSDAVEIQFNVIKGATS